MIELSPKIHPALRFARGLMSLKATYDDIPRAWNPTGICLVRVSLERRLRENRAAAAELRAFLRLTGFGIAGATDPRTRLFSASPETMHAAADAIEQNDLTGPTLRYVANCTGFVESAIIDREVSNPDKIDYPLAIQYHLTSDGTAWNGITQMLDDLGATKIGNTTYFDNGPGYGYATVERKHVETIAKHPLVRHLGVVPKIGFRDKHKTQKVILDHRMALLEKPHTDI
jgi:hypothetical protein